MKVGMSIINGIGSAMSKASSGIVVISRDYLAKDYPRYELNGLLTNELVMAKTIFPIWHNVTFAEVLNYDPALADKFALNTADYNAQYIAHRIHDIFLDEAHKRD
jgi:hypothetical protein